MKGTRALKSVVLQVVGWALVLLGVAALVLPGPGLLALFAGMAVLATQYRWAERRLQSVKNAALRTAADSVATPRRILVSVAGVAGLAAVGVVWGLRPHSPFWWPLADRWWLPGGWGTAGSLLVSAVLAAGMVIYSYRNFRQIRHEESTENDKLQD